MMGSRYIRASNMSSTLNYTLNQFIQFFILATSLQFLSELRYFGYATFVLRLACRFRDNLLATSISG